MFRILAGFNKQRRICERFSFDTLYASVPCRYELRLSTYNFYVLTFSKLSIMSSFYWFKKLYTVYLFWDKQEGVCNKDVHLTVYKNDMNVSLYKQGIWHLPFGWLHTLLADFSFRLFICFVGMYSFTSLISSFHSCGRPLCEWTRNWR